MGYVHSAIAGRDDLFSFFTSLTVTLPATSASGNTIIVDLAYHGSSGSSGAVGMFDSAGNTYTRAVTASFVSCTGDCWYSAGIVGGGPITLTVAFTGTGGFDSLTIAMHEYSNIVTASPVDATGNASSITTSIVTASLTTGNDVDLIHGFGGNFGFDGGMTFVPGQQLAYTTREIGAASAGLLTFDVPFSYFHPATISASMHPQRAVITPGHYGIILVAFKVPLSPSNPGAAWLLIRDPAVGYIDHSHHMHIGDGQSKHSVSNILRQRGTAEIPLIIKPGDTYVPQEGSQVFVYDQPPAGHVLIFAGTIERQTITWLSSTDDHIVTLSCVSLEASFDTILVPPQVFYQQTAANIFLTLMQTVAGGVLVAVGIVTAPFVINILDLTNPSWQRLSEVFNQIASAASCIWGIDLATLTVFMHAPSTTGAPYTLHSQQLQFGSSTWNQNRQDYRNRQIVRISQNAFAQSAELFAAPGSPPTVPVSFALMRPAIQITNAWFTKNTQNHETGTFTDNPAPGDQITIGYPQTGSIYNWVPNAPYAVGQIIIDPSNHIQQVTTQGTSGAAQPSWNDSGGNTTDGPGSPNPSPFNGAVIWLDEGVSGVGGLGAATYTFVTDLDNTQWGQVLISVSGFVFTCYNLVQAINANPDPTIVGVLYSWPTWENPTVNAEYQAANIVVRNKNSGAGYISSLATTSANFSWASAQTNGGSTAGPGTTVSLQIAAVGSSNTANLYYSPGSISISVASRPSGVSGSGWSVAVNYQRAAGDCIVVENTAEVNARATIENGTGKYQQITDQTSVTSNTQGLLAAQSILGAYGTIPISFSFVAWKAGLAPGQWLTISLANPAPVNLQNLINGTYVIQQVDAELLPAQPYMDQSVVPGGGHYQYTITVVNQSQVSSYLAFWQQLASGGGGNTGLVVSTAAPAQSGGGPGGGLVQVTRNSVPVVY